MRPRCRLAGPEVRYGLFHQGAHPRDLGHLFALMRERRVDQQHAGQFVAVAVGEQHAIKPGERMADKDVGRPEICSMQQGMQVRCQGVGVARQRAGSEKPCPART